MAIKLVGNWKQGFAFDKHIKQSTYIGDSNYGYPMFETSYSLMGKLVHDLKYKNKIENSQLIVELLINEFSGWDSFDYIIPAPFSTNRINQPVVLISKELSSRTNIPTIEALYKKGNIVSLKNLNSTDEKINELKKTIHIVHNELIKNKSILLIDDLYDSGSTLNISTQILLDNGAKSVSVLAMTKTKG